MMMGVAVPMASPGEAGAHTKSCFTHRLSVCEDGCHDQLNGIGPLFYLVRCSRRCT